MRHPVYPSQSSLPSYPKSKHQFCSTLLFPFPFPSLSSWCTQNLEKDNDKTVCSDVKIYIRHNVHYSIHICQFPYQTWKNRKTKATMISWKHSSRCAVTSYYSSISIVFVRATQKKRQIGKTLSGLEKQINRHDLGTFCVNFWNDWQHFEKREATWPTTSHHAYCLTFSCLGPAQTFKKVFVLPPQTKFRCTVRSDVIVHIHHIVQGLPIPKANINFFKVAKKLFRFLFPSFSSWFTQNMEKS